MKKKNRRLLNTALVVALTTIFSYGIYKTANVEKASADSTTTNYELAINMNNSNMLSSDLSQSYIEQEGSRNLIYNSTNKKQNITNGNFAINVNGTYYENSTYTINYTNPLQATSTGILARNQDSRTNPNGTIYPYCTRVMFALSMTGYNSNVNTEYEMTIRLKLGIPQSVDTDIKMIKTVYKSTDDLSFIINRQDWTTLNNINYYTETIKSANNGYVYTQTQEIDYISNMADDYQVYTNTDTYTISPNITTYFIIVLEPYIDDLNERYIYGYDTGETKTNKIYYTEGTVLNFTGTNVIPTGQYEIVNISGLLFEILTMPFTFISMAFDVTLFPNTPYSINISQLLLALIAVLVFVFLLKIIIAVAKGG